MLKANLKIDSPKTLFYFKAVIYFIFILFYFCGTQEDSFYRIIKQLIDFIVTARVQMS